MKIVKGNKTSEINTSELREIMRQFRRVHIDLGTGDGRFIFERAKLDPQTLFIGIDPSKKQMEIYSKKVLRAKLENVLFIVGSLETLPNIFDFIEEEKGYGGTKIGGSKGRYGSGSGGNGSGGNGSNGSKSKKTNNDTEFDMGWIEGKRLEEDTITNLGPDSGPPGVPPDKEEDEDWFGLKKKNNLGPGVVKNRYTEDMEGGHWQNSYRVWSSGFSDVNKSKSNGKTKNSGKGRGVGSAEKVGNAETTPIYKKFEDLEEEEKIKRTYAANGAQEITVYLPWGTLLQALVVPKIELVKNISRLLKPGGTLTLLLGYTVEADPGETLRLSLPPLTKEYLQEKVAPKMKEAGLILLDIYELDDREDLKLFLSTWSKKLAFGRSRSLFLLRFMGTGLLPG